MCASAHNHAGPTRLFSAYIVSHIQQQAAHRQLAGKILGEQHQPVLGTAQHGTKKCRKGDARRAPTSGMMHLRKSQTQLRKQKNEFVWKKCNQTSDLVNERPNTSSILSTCSRRIRSRCRLCASPAITESGCKADAVSAAAG